MPSGDNYKSTDGDGYNISWWIVDADATPTSYASKTPDGTTLDTAKAYLKNPSKSGEQARIAIRYDATGYVSGLYAQSQVFIIYEIPIEGAILTANLYEDNDEYNISYHMTVKIQMEMLCQAEQYTLISIIQMRNTM